MFWEFWLVIIAFAFIFIVVVALKALFWLSLIRLLWRKGNKK